MNEAIDVMIGKKGTMTYVGAVIAALGQKKEVVIKARGKAISKAVDVAEITRNKFCPNFKIREIRTSTQEVILKNKKGTMNVSCMEIIGNG